jgi:hypothetical protein
MGIEMGIALRFASAINKLFLLDALEKCNTPYFLDQLV